MPEHSDHTLDNWKRLLPALGCVVFLMILPPTSTAAMATIMLAPFAALFAWVGGLLYGRVAIALIALLYLALTVTLFVQGIHTWLTSG